MNALISRFRELKKNLNITNREIAERAGVHIGTVDRIMSGNAANPSADTVQRISDALGVDGDELRALISTPEPVPEPTLNYMALLAEKDARYSDMKTVLERHLLSRSKWLLVSVLLNIFIILFICAVLFIDITNRSIGWIRSAQSLTTFIR